MSDMSVWPIVIVTIASLIAGGTMGWILSEWWNNDDLREHDPK